MVWEPNIKSIVYIEPWLGKQYFYLFYFYKLCELLVF